MKNQDLPVEFQGKANFLYNLQLLQGDENLAKKAKDPEIWLNEHYQNDKSKIKAYKERNFIDPNFDLHWQKIAEFEKERSEKIKLQLETIFGLKKKNASA